MKFNEVAECELDFLCSYEVSKNVFQSKFFMFKSLVQSLLLSGVTVHGSNLIWSCILSTGLILFTYAQFSLLEDKQRLKCGDI